MYIEWKPCTQLYFYVHRYISVFVSYKVYILLYIYVFISLKLSWMCHLLLFHTWGACNFAPQRSIKYFWFLMSRLIDRSTDVHLDGSDQRKHPVCIRPVCLLDCILPLIHISCEKHRLEQLARRPDAGPSGAVLPGPSACQCYIRASVSLPATIDWSLITKGRDLCCLSVISDTVWVVLNDMACCSRAGHHDTAAAVSADSLPGRADVRPGRPAPACG